MTGPWTTPTAARGGLAPWQLRLAVRLLLGEACGEVRIAQVAGRCGLSRTYFERAFKMSVGTPPHRWAVRQRVRRAVDMLDLTEDSVCQIASICGFADQSHLTRVFSAAVGTSPAAWRRRRRAGQAPPVALSPSPAETRSWLEESLSTPQPDWRDNPLAGIQLPACRDSGRLNRSDAVETATPLSAADPLRPGG